MSTPESKITGDDEYLEEKQQFLDFLNTNPIPTCEEIVKFTRNMPPRLVDEIKFIMSPPTQNTTVTSTETDNEPSNTTTESKDTTDTNE